MIVVLWGRASLALESLVMGSLALELREQEGGSVGRKRVGFLH